MARFTIILLLLLSFITSADTFKSKDWLWSTDNSKYFYAGTSGSGNSFGQYCYFGAKRCLYLINTGMICENNEKLSALLNSNIGAKHITLLCGTTRDGRNVFQVTPFKVIDYVVRQARYVDIAIPLRGELFQVTRFSLVGSAYAIDLMRAATEKVIGILEQDEKLPDEILL